MKLGNRLREFRFQNNQISQQDLANAVGVTRLTILSIENGRFTPSAFLALKIARYFNVHFEDIFYLDEEGQDK